MKAVVYSIKSFEKEYLAKANQKKHDITLISNPLGIDTVGFAQGKDAVIVFTNDDVSAPVIKKLKKLGVKYIATRSVGTDHIDCETATAVDIKIANVPSYSPQSIAEHAIALMMALNRKIFIAIQQSKELSFKLDGLQGFTMYGKTVGLIGFGQIAQFLARILNGFGCNVLVYDPYCKIYPDHVKRVELSELYKQSNIISLNAALTDETKDMINAESISQMRKDVMLINTSRGALINTKDLVAALKKGRIASFGADVYESEKNLSFEDDQLGEDKEKSLRLLTDLPNVVVTPHQAFLTTEALQDIAAQTIKNLDLWQLGQCTGDACACTTVCEENLKNRESLDDSTVDILF
ncbi:2-hydroxyacid dehydrogenase [Pedobacter arcticus]|uniref:2-hydroxyacid dehydrogenase n=1 Tax=Pedobacter arcticus TaxID=752140 RepID=UPI0002E8811A|nr:2-hydroxyacid dehydrogenase [Pedobacter arcticus]